MNSDFIKIIKPQTLQEFEAYYFLSYKILRKPWNRELGSEKDDQEADSIHAMACNQNKLVLGVCRLQLNSTHEAQIRYMAVEENVRVWDRKKTNGIYGKGSNQNKRIKNYSSF